MTEHSEMPATSESESPQPSAASTFWSRHKGEIGLVFLFGYVALLALGTIGELFDIEWILDLPLFRPPGKY